MNTEEKILIELLNHFIHNTSPNLPEEIDWDQVVYLAHINAVLGIVSYMISKYQLQKDEDVLNACKSYYERIYKKFRYLSKKTKEFSKELSDHHIDHVLFKGSVVKDMYPVPEFRTYGDVDLLIRRDQREQSRKVCSNLGYDESVPWEPVFNYRRDHEYYEIHTELLETDIVDRPGCRTFFLDPWNHTIKCDNHRFIFKPEYHFVYLLTHMAKHLASSGAGIRMYMDIAVYIQHYGSDLDWEEIRRYLRELDLTEFAETVLYAVSRWFDTESPMIINGKDPTFMDEFTEYTLYGGIFGFDDKDTGDRDLNRAVRQDPALNRMRILRKRLFPPAKQIETRYTYLQKRSWLLPVAWIHRIVITRDSYFLHKQELKQIFKADSAEAKKRDEMLKRAGL